MIRDRGGATHLKILLALFVALCSLFAVSCRQALSPASPPYTPRWPSPPDVQIPQGHGAFFVEVMPDVSTARTIMPVAPNLSDFQVFTFIFTSDTDLFLGGAVFPEDTYRTRRFDRTYAALAQPIILPVGTYTLLVNAFFDSDRTRLAAQGSPAEPVVINPGANDPIELQLYAVTDGDRMGTFTWDITLSAVLADLTFAAMTVSDGPTADLPYIDLTTANNLVGLQSLRSGIYRVTVNLQKRIDDGGEIPYQYEAVWTELLHIYPELTSHFGRTVTAEDFRRVNNTVTFVFNDFITPERAQRVPHAGMVARPANPARGGFIFSGWYRDAGFTARHSFGAPIISPITLFARWTPGVLPPPPVIAAGGNHTAAIRNGGELWAWGSNEYGQLGAGAASSIPLSVGTGWAAVSAGQSHTVAIRQDGSLWAWGFNEYGRLGDGTTSARSSPVRIGLDSDWVSVSAGWHHTMALRADGTLWAWGGNWNGRLGDGTIIDRPSPVRIGLDYWRSVSAGHTHTLAIQEDGSLWAWGQNQSGELGDDTGITSYSPVRVGTYSDWHYVSAGNHFSMAIREDRSLWAWGLGANGRTGLGDTDNRLSPAQVMPGTVWATVSTGPQYTVAIRDEGGGNRTLYAWGSNENGQLGVDTLTGSLSPVPVNAPHTDWLAVSAGSDGHHTVATRPGQLWTWGRNAAGQIGDGYSGTAHNRLSPVRIWPYLEVPAFTFTFTLEPFHRMAAASLPAPLRLTSPELAQATITLADADNYDNIRWFRGEDDITGDMVSGARGETLVLDSRVHGNRIGAHTVTAEARRGGVLYSLVISFTVALN